MEWFLYDNGLRHERVNGRQEITKSIVTNIFVPWIFEIFVCSCYFVHTWG